MKKQIAALLGVLTHPRRTMQALPSDRLYALAILSPLYFGIVRAFRQRNHALLHNALGGNIQIILLVLAISVVMLPLGGWLVQQILRLFRKRLSIVKILNINGYAYVPRLIVALIGYVLLVANPSAFTFDRFTPPLIAIIALGFMSMIYTICLMIYGIVVSPSEASEGANKALQQTRDSVLRNG